MIRRDEDRFCVNVMHDCTDYVVHTRLGCTNKHKQLSDSVVNFVQFDMGLAPDAPLMPHMHRPQLSGYRYRLLVSSYGTNTTASMV